MKWVTWENIGVDRMGSIWLIRRRIDPHAQFSFIPVGAKPPAAGAEPFDIPGVRLSHHRGHCTFYALLKEYKLTDPVLGWIARIIDEADIVQEAMLESVAAGLDLICRGLRRTSRDDLEALERGCLVYDGLYAELSVNQ